MFLLDIPKFISEFKKYPGTFNPEYKKENFKINVVEYIFGYKNHFPEHRTYFYILK